MFLGHDFYDEFSKTVQSNKFLLVLTWFYFWALETNFKKAKTYWTSSAFTRLNLFFATCGKNQAKLRPFFFFSPNKNSCQTSSAFTRLNLFDATAGLNALFCIFFLFFFYGNTMSYYDHECCTLYYQSQFIMVSKKKKKITIYNIFPPCKNTQKF